MTIEVIHDFHDFDGGLWKAGFQLRVFKNYNFLPYEGGYTFYFTNATLRLCENVDSDYDVLFNSARYFRVVEAQ